MDDRRAADYIVFHIDVDVTVFFRCQVGQHMREIRAVKLARLRGHAARQIGKSDNADVMFHRDHTRFGQFAIAALFGGQIDDNRARMHGFDHVGGDQLRRGFARN